MRGDNVIYVDLYKVYELILEKRLAWNPKDLTLDFLRGQECYYIGKLYPTCINRAILFLRENMRSDKRRKVLKFLIERGVILNDHDLKL